MSFKSYAISKGIYEFDELTEIKSKIYTDENIFEHINILCDLHERLKGCSIPLNNLTNKMVEDFRVAEIFLKQDIEKYCFNPKNKFEKCVLKFGDKVLERIRKILKMISSINYEGIILRSIKNKEICVYNVNFSDVQAYKNSKIFVKNIDEFCENIIEYDYIKFFTKLKRSNKNVDFMKWCAYVCNKEKFNTDSYNFILACISFPYEFIRSISKYRDLGGEFSNFHNECDFNYILEKDKNILI